MRTLALAQGLRARGAQVTYFSREGPHDMHPAIRSAGFALVVLPRSASASETWLGVEYGREIAESARAFSLLDPFDLLVVDHYGIDAEWETRMRPFCSALMAIDDLANRNHDCDVLLDQNLVCESERRYEPLIPKNARALLGPRYALLREEFRDGCFAARKRDGRIERLFVFIGGVDDSDETSKVLRAISGPQMLRLHVVVLLGKSAPYAPAVRDRCAALGFTYLEGLQSVAPLMNAADLAIGAVGSATWERCALGLPALALTVAANQRPSARACDRAGALRWLGDAAQVDERALAAALQQMMSEPSRVLEMSRKARDVIDPSDFSTDRVVECLYESAA